MLNSVGNIPKYIYSGHFYANVTGEIFNHKKCTYSLLDPFILHLFFRLIILFPYMTGFHLGTPEGFCNQCRQTVSFNI